MTETDNWLPGANQTKPKRSSNGPTKSSLSETTSLNQSSQGFENTSHHEADTGAEHLASFTVDPLEGEGDDLGGIDGLSNLADESGEFISQDAFFLAFCQAFNIAACIPPYFTSLKIEDEETAQARGASDALYDICLETPAMQFLIKPGGVWFQRVAAISAFALPKAMGIKAEMKAKRAKPVRSPARQMTDEEDLAEQKKHDRDVDEALKPEKAHHGGQYDWAPA